MGFSKKNRDDAKKQFEIMTFVLDNEKITDLTLIKMNATKNIVFVIRYGRKLNHSTSEPITRYDAISELSKWVLVM